MTAFSGSALYLAWAYSGGTVMLQTDFRQFAWEPSLNLIDSTAGADTFQESIPGIGIPGNISLTTVMQSGGTALISALAKGNQGTLIFGPAGTATGQPKSSIPAISMGPRYSQPYNDVVEFSVDFHQSAQHTDGAW